MALELQSRGNIVVLKLCFYQPLSEGEMHKLPISTVNKIGQHFIDSTDAPVIIEGTITGIFRERKSRSLCYKYYDTNLFASAPRNKDKYEYIVVKWALSNVNSPSPSQLYKQSPT